MIRRNGMSIKEFLDVQCQDFVEDVRGSSYRQVLFHNAPRGFLSIVSASFLNAFGMPELNIDNPKILIDPTCRKGDNFEGTGTYVIDVGWIIRSYQIYKEALKYAKRDVVDRANLIRVLV